MSELTAAQFEAFFRELHGYAPFPWQGRLAARVCEGNWPQALDLPTASGKTACIDVAVFAMAVRQRGPRRVFFVVDRRVVVDAAFARMEKIATKLREASEGVLEKVARRLREMGGSEEPLVAYQLRGGIYRDDSWVRSPLQPMVIASTVDQTGSRLLFRGFGVWDKALPVHASLVGNDSLILLDEAHCSRPFSETVAAVGQYRGKDWTETSLDLPFAFVEMTATPSRTGGDCLRLDEDDYADPVLRTRLYAKKPASVVVSKARVKDYAKLAEDLVREAEELGKAGNRIAVMVNRVRTARLVYRALKDRSRRTQLLIGRMRPFDRTNLPDELRKMLAGNAREEEEPVFVVATQCLEVGADLDFDAVVTECASIDALLQRFGRLDRIGDLSASGRRAAGRIVISSAMTDEEYVDAVYGTALNKTWQWLNECGELDFGICSETGDRTVRERLGKIEGDGLRRATPLFPVLLPAHLDALVQTSPRPAIEPDVSLFLHGEEKGSPEVQVVWRRDLDPEAPEQWAEIVALCPPVTNEAMAVPLWDFIAWLRGQEEVAVSSDIEGVNESGPQTEDTGSIRCPVLRWRGDDSRVVERPADIVEILAGDTLMVAAESEGWNDLGHKPAEMPADVAEPARRMLRRGWVLRLHPKLVREWPETPARVGLLDAISQRDSNREELLGALNEYRKSLDGAATGWLQEMLAEAETKPDVNAYPEIEGKHVGWVLSGRFVEADSGRDESSSFAPVALGEHLADVMNEVKRTAAGLLTDETLRCSLIRAASLHDYGKADRRFQALLRGGDPTAAQFSQKLLAKGTQSKQSKEIRRAQWRRSGLPDDFRHELVSLLMAQETVLKETDGHIADLVLHLIASHHGRCRPFAPVVEDDSGGDVEWNGMRLTAGERAIGAAHRLESGVPDRFWVMTRRYGWWGLAYLESILRLCDWSASKKEEGGAKSK